MTDLGLSEADILTSDFESCGLVRVLVGGGDDWAGELLSPLANDHGQVAVAKPLRSLNGPPRWERVLVHVSRVRSIG